MTRVRGRAPWRWILLVPALALSLLGGWAAAHHLPGTARVAPLWSERDLPALPPEADNGWAAFQALAADFPGDRRLDTLRRAIEAEDAPHLGPLAEPVRALLDDPALSARTAAARAALARPRFADACPLDLEASCHPIQQEALHDLVAADALGVALRGDPGEALARAAALLGADLDLARTSRRPMSAMLARRAVRLDLRVVSAILGDPAHDAGAGGAEFGVLGAVDELLARASEPDRAGARAVVAEYLEVEGALRSLFRRAVSAVDGDWTVLLYLDPADTLARANTYFLALAAFADDPVAQAAPVVPRFRGQRGWWIYNPGGKLVLDITLADLAGPLRALPREDARIAGEATALRARVASVRGREASAPAAPVGAPSR